LTLLGGVCIHLFCGNLYLWGNISTYVVSYYHFVHGDNEANLKIAKIVLPIIFTLLTLFNPIGAYLVKKGYNPKLILTLGSAVMLSAIFMCTIVTKWWLFVYFYALQFPMGIGLVYYTPIVCCWEWFPEKRGLVTGIIVAGFGFGAFIFGFISSAIINPDGLKVSIPFGGEPGDDKLFPLEVAERVPHMFRTCLIIWAILCAISISLVSRNPLAKEQAN
jgi:OFA family oxalate/formate antiporter-like MFS transporter